LFSKPRLEPKAGAKQQEKSSIKKADIFHKKTGRYPINLI